VVFVSGVGALGEGVLLEFMGLGSFFLGFLFLLGGLWSWAAGKGGLGNLWTFVLVSFIVLHLWSWG
jgi:hypothetical protein